MTDKKPDRKANKTNNYEVGYKKPPLATRFKLGQSGSPRGRPPLRESFHGLLEALMARHIIVTENGKSKRMTRREALVHNLFGAAIKGKPRAMEIIMKIINQSTKEEQKPDLSVLTESELNLLEHLNKKMFEPQMEAEIRRVKRKYGR